MIFHYVLRIPLIGTQPPASALTSRLIQLESLHWNLSPIQSLRVEILSYIWYDISLFCHIVEMIYSACNFLMLCFLVNPGRHCSQLRPIVWSLAGALVAYSRKLPNSLLIIIQRWNPTLHSSLNQTRSTFVGSEMQDPATHYILMKLHSKLKFSIWIEFEWLWWIKWF